MKRFVLAVVIILVVAIGFREVGRRNRSRPGKGSLGSAAASGVPSVAPGFVLEDLDGQRLDLSSYRGRVVLLDFWATWCTPCRSEIPRFVDLQGRYRDQGLQVIGISMDDGPKPVRDFYREFKMNYPVALGTEKVAESYGGVLGLPINFLIDRDGRIAAKYVGEVEMPVLEREIQTLLQAK
jgi:peroxiredoxin